ncbi:hypothetical protein Pmani_011458 [Petrolisthes manimaculis]|uniref:Ionotropic glutamate receptor L-glutamate and glycine-binding domain-containing protein n=1 Tax=Petrolisthes manimaculis TaxID=1843537 RepID=A0AAE1Q2D9_9EUCA|nr:hypothetical protein Pmani_011458 [Petrolisthes manimaculis]
MYQEKDEWWDEGIILRQLGKPFTLATLDQTTETGSVMAIPHIGTSDRVNTCSVYFILTANVSAIREVLESTRFESELDYLGHFIFVTESTPLAAQLILDNDVMAWRPNAIVIKRSGRPGDTGDYDIWSHEVFRENVTERVYLVDTLQRGHPKKGNHLFPDKLDNFHGNQLKAVTFEHAPSIVDIHDDEGGHTYDGIDIRLLQILAEALNFHLTIMNPSDGGKWGSPLENGTWTGLTGDLTQRRAHMGVANLFIHIHYLEVVDMTLAYDMEFGCFITPLPEPLPQWVALIYPFSLPVWVMTLLLLGVGTVLLHITSLMSHHIIPLQDNTASSSSLSLTPNITTTTSASSPSLTLNVFYATGIFFGVGMPRVPRSDVTRSYLIMWIWYGLLLTVVYRSSLTAFLTIPLVQPPINTLQELVSSSLPAWGATGLTFKKMLEENPDPMVQELALRYHPVGSAEEGIHLTAQRMYAMMENRQFLEYMIATNYTNKYGEETLHVMNECFLPFRIGMALPKKAPYKPNFDKIVSRVVEAGLVRKWFGDILFSSRKRGSGDTQEREAGALSLDNLQGAWLVVGGGLFTSLVTFLLETLTAKVCQ